MTGRIKARRDLRRPDNAAAPAVGPSGVATSRHVQIHASGRMLSGHINTYEVIERRRLYGREIKHG